MNRTAPRTLTVAPVRKSVRVNAAAARAFEVFTQGLGRWWPPSHHIGTAPLKEAVMEPRVGGRWYERGEDGSECDWGKVLVWEPPHRVMLSWEIDASFKRNASTSSEVEIRFIPESASVTVVELEHRNIERLGANAEDFRNKVDAPNGWTGILQIYVAAVERSPQSPGG